MVDCSIMKIIYLNGDFNQKGAGMTFQQKLREAVITNIDPKLKPVDVLEDAFKFYVAEMLKLNIQQNKNRIAAGFIQSLCAYAITEFRNSDLGEHQQAETWYANLFNKCIQEILNDAAHAHKGEDSAVRDKTQDLIRDLRPKSRIIIPT